MILSFHSSKLLRTKYIIVLINNYELIRVWEITLNLEKKNHKKRGSEFYLRAVNFNYSIVRNKRSKCLSANIHD